MSAEIRRLLARMTGQEKRTVSLQADIEEVSQDVQTNLSGLGDVKASMEEMKAHMATKEDLTTLSASVEKQFEEMKQGVNQQFKEIKQGVNQRFEHVYGKLADIESNTVDIRNVLATLVARLEKE